MSFSGSNFVLDWLNQPDARVVNPDLSAYAGNRRNLALADADARRRFMQGDIGDEPLLVRLFTEYLPRTVINLVAEPHVDRSILGLGAFVNTNVVGSFRLLEAALADWCELADAERYAFRFLHVSTDEIYDSLSADAPAFNEEHWYHPNSPYPASKASDHFVRAYSQKYKLPVFTTSCSKSYGHSADRVGEVHDIGGLNEKTEFQSGAYDVYAARRLGAARRWEQLCDADRLRGRPTGP